MTKPHAAAPRKKPHRILLIAHSEDVATQVRRALEPHEDLSLVGVSRSGMAGIRSLSQRKADMVLVEMHMPGMEGLETTLRIKSRERAPRAVVLTPMDSLAYRLATEAAEADDYVPIPLMEDLLPKVIRVLFRKKVKAGEVADWLKV